MGTLACTAVRTCPWVGCTPTRAPPCSLACQWALPMAASVAAWPPRTLAVLVATASPLCHYCQQQAAALLVEVPPDGRPTEPAPAPTTGPPPSLPRQRPTAASTTLPRPLPLPPHGRRLGWGTRAWGLRRPSEWIAIAGAAVTAVRGTGAAGTPSRPGTTRTTRAQPPVRAAAAAGSRQVRGRTKRCTLHPDWY